jgi:DNA polymerase III epsilon subunit-like protein
MFIYLGTETTGNGPDDRLCQIAFKPENGPAVSELPNPGRPISIDAMVVHHITEKVVADKPPFMGIEACDKLRELVSDAKNVIVAHNSQFDMKMLHMLKIYLGAILIITGGTFAMA